MKNWKRVLIVLCMAFAELAPQQYASAQLRIQLQEIDALGLPVIRLKCLLTDGALPVQQPGRATYTLTDNGRPAQLAVDCPDSAVINSVAMALDNSGSMGSSIAALQKAAKLLVDSLRINDEAALVAFGQGVRFIQGFTANKPLLHNAIDSLKAGGGTPLWDATLFAIQQLAKRPGKKILLVLTDGTDNNSTATFSDVLAAAKAAGVKIFTIGFGNTQLSDTELNDLAVQTGGKYFRTFSDTEFAQIFAAIVSEIVSPSCILTYTASNCTDSLRFLHLEARYNGELVVLDTVFHAPFRADTISLRVTGPAQIVPNGNAIVYIALQPGLSTGLKSSFHFLLRYDPQFLAPNPTTAITVGTISQNTIVGVTKLRDGVLRFDAELIQPGLATGNLTGVRFKGLPIDSSRRLVFSIDSLSFEAGCPNTVFVTQNEADFCACKSSVFAWMDNMRIVESGAEALIPVYASDTTFAGSFQFILDLNFDTTKMILEDFAPGPNSLRSVAIRWEKLSGGQYRIYGEGVKDKRDSMLVVARCNIIRQKNTDSAGIAIPQLKAYARCCSALPGAVEQAVLVDGVCTPLVVRKSLATLQQSIPNPVRGKAVIPFEIHGSSATEQYQVQLRLYNESGRPIALLYEDTFTRGSRQVAFDASQLAAGTYYLSLQCGGETEIRAVSVVK